MSRLSVSVFIIARDEADRLPRALASVMAWADEVLVIDSGSNDATREVAARAGARVIEHAWQGYGAQKIFAESQCRNNWVLNIDADEEVDAELARGITELFASDEPKHSAYHLAVQPVYSFQQQGHPWTITNHPLRLYRRDRAGFRDSPVHDAVIVRSGSTGDLPGVLLHRWFRSLTHHVDKVNAYSSAQAEDYIARGRRPSALALLLVPPLAFLKSFFLRREFVNGVDGVVISYMYAFQRFIRLSKARERLQRDRSKCQ